MNSRIKSSACDSHPRTPRIPLRRRPSPIFFAPPALMKSGRPRRPFLRSGPVAQGIEQQPSKLKVPGSNPGGVAKNFGSVPDTWVTVSSDHMGNTLGSVVKTARAFDPVPVCSGAPSPGAAASAARDAVAHGNAVGRLPTLSHRIRGTVSNLTNVLPSKHSPVLIARAPVSPVRSDTDAARPLRDRMVARRHT